MGDAARVSCTRGTTAANSSAGSFPFTPEFQETEFLL